MILPVRLGDRCLQPGVCRVPEIFPAPINHCTQESWCAGAYLFSHFR